MRAEEKTVFLHWQSKNVKAGRFGICVLIEALRFAKT